MHRRIFYYEFSILFSNKIRIGVAHVNLTKPLTEREREREKKRRKKSNFSPNTKKKTYAATKSKTTNKRAHGWHRVACFDLQPALLTPPGDTAAFYYKSKLLTYNFPVCDLQKEDQLMLTVIHGTRAKQEELPLK